MAYHYIRAGATGSANGSDWTNAWTALPATLTRGDSYYVATGTYTDTYTFDDAESGTDLITIKRATVSDHGTDTGWDNAYDGVAEFGVLKFETGYNVFDGVTWNGFKILCTTVTGGGGGGTVLVTAANNVLGYCWLYGTYAVAFGHSFALNSTDVTCSLRYINFDGSPFEDHLNVVGTGGTLSLDHCRFSHLGHPSDGQHRDLMNPYGATNGGWNLSITNSIIFGDFADAVLLQTEVKLGTVTVEGCVFKGLTGRVIGFGSGGAGCTVLNLRNNVYWGCGYDYLGSGTAPDAIISINNFYGGGVIGSSVTSTYTLWASGTSGYATGTGNVNNVTTANFLNTNAPDGDDGIPFTQNDGFNFSDGSALLGAGNATTRNLDILGNAVTDPPSVGPYSGYELPAQPTDLSATADGSSSIDLAWTDNSSDETGFKIERSTDGVTFAQIATVGAGVTSYADTGLAGGVTYYYRVRAYNDNGNSAYSNAASDVTAPTPIPIAWGCTGGQTALAGMI